MWRHECLDTSSQLGIPYLFLRKESSIQNRHPPKKQTKVPPGLEYVTMRRIRNPVDQKSCDMTQLVGKGRAQPFCEQRGNKSIFGVHGEPGKEGGSSPKQSMTFVESSTSACLWTAPSRMDLWQQQRINQQASKQTNNQTTTAQRSEKYWRRRWKRW